MNSKETAPEVILPWSVRNSRRGVILSAIGLGVGGLLVNIVDIFVPIKGNGMPVWMWPILITIWLPGVLGLGIGYYAIMRYPYISLVCQLNSPRLTTGWLKVLLAIIFYVLAAGLTYLFLAILIWSPKKDISGVLSILYFLVECWFVGFMFFPYHSDRHPTIATFIHLSCGLGVILVPLYIPAIVIGTLRCRAFLANSLDESQGPSQSLY